MNLPPPEIRLVLVQAHARIGDSNGADELEKVHQLLAAHGLTWSDWTEFFGLMTPPSAMPHKQRRRFLGLHASMGRASTAGQRKHARNVLIKLIAEHSLSWSKDLPAILAADWLEKNPISSPGKTPGPTVSMDGPDVNVFDLDRQIIERRVVLTPAQCTVATF
jgi:hypothetical protein